MKLTICPICDSSKIKTVTSKMSFQTPDGEIVIPKITRQKCETCGEEFFDHEANEVLDQYRGRMVQDKRGKGQKSLVK
jgi:YgiT-type zinc finger domain-containing protein